MGGDVGKLRAVRNEARSTVGELRELRDWEGSFGGAGGGAPEVEKRVLARLDRLMSAFSSHEGWERSGVTMCCGCGRLFFIEGLVGRFMDRRCPLCGIRLHEGAYDERARDISKQLRSGAGGGGEALARELERLAMARYLESEWHLLTGTPTSLLGFDATEEGYSFTPAYDKLGRFDLRINYGANEVRGIAGELALFEALRFRVNDRCSPLYGAKIVPSVNLTENGVGERGRLTVSKHQTDCVLLVPTGAFVFEVKRWRARIAVHAPHCTVRVARGKGETAYRPDEGPVAQARENRKSLLAHCPELAGDRACSVVVFVDPVELAGDVGKLPCGKGVFFAKQLTHGKGTVRKAVEGCAAAWAVQANGRIPMDVAEVAGRLLAENSRYELPLDPRGRM